MRPLLILVALSAERRAVASAVANAEADRLGDRAGLRGRIGRQEVWVVQAGLGRARARAALLAAAAQEPLAAGWSAGFAAGLSERLRPGALMVPSVVLGAGPSVRFAAHPSSRDIQHALSAGIPVDTDLLVTVDTPVTTPGAKRRLAVATGAAGADMEAAGVAEAAQAVGCPWLALKVVLDAYDDVLPSALARAVQADGSTSWTGLLRALPAWPALPRLARRSRLAAHRLGAALHAAVSAWAALTPPGLSSTMSAP